jgi:hypothetical protein
MINQRDRAAPAPFEMRQIRDVVRDGSGALFIIPAAANDP